MNVLIPDFRLHITYSKSSLWLLCICVLSRTSRTPVCLDLSMDLSFFLLIFVPSIPPFIPSAPNLPPSSTRQSQYSPIHTDPNSPRPAMGHVVPLLVLGRGQTARLLPDSHPLLHDLLIYPPTPHSTTQSLNT